MKLLNWDDFDLSLVLEVQDVWKSSATIRLTKSEQIVWKSIQSSHSATTCFMQYVAGYHTLNGKLNKVIFDFAFPAKKLAINIDDTVMGTYTYASVSYPETWKVLVLTAWELQDPGLGQLIKNFLR